MCIETRRQVMTPRLAIVALILLILISSISYSVSGVASENLAVNGGFETGDFTGWNTDATCQIKSLVYLKPHSGWYCARIGAENRIGTLSQTITIPEKSKANLSFSYRLDENASLDVYLREVSGEIIQSWSLKGETEGMLMSARMQTEWKVMNYQIDPKFAGKQITLEFKGKVYTEERLVPTDLQTADGEGVVFYVWIKQNYWIYVDDVSVVSKIVNYDTNVKISGLPGSLSTKISLDEQMQGPVQGGTSKTFRFVLGELHKLKVEEIVYDTQRVRYVCKRNSANTNASSDQAVAFDYVPQYLLTMESPYGKTEGSGWYTKGDTAKFSVLPTAISLEGLVGSLGAKYRFKGWNGDIKSELSLGEVKMDYPKNAVAAWDTDYSSVYMISNGVIITIICVLFLVIFRKKLLSFIRD